MAHESFEDPETAALMNAHFINIKVDREERPDIDGIYMTAVQAITGGGGWPMSVWLLPDGRPFFGGTYFPDTPRHRLPSFRQVLMQIADLYREHRDDLEHDATQLTEAVSRQIRLEESNPITEAGLQAAYQSFATEFDRTYAGFGDAPKFPPSMALEFLLRLHHRYGWAQALTMVTATLDKMMRGGMYDQLGGGFHRYSVDARWLVPHFEKMLYDNALLMRVYLYGWQVTGDEDYADVVRQIAAYVKREMTAREGGFYSSQDADSEGHEGKFFTWKEPDLHDLLDGHIDNADAVLDYWGVTGGPNFEGQSILWVPQPLDKVAVRHEIESGALRADIKKARGILFDQREKRVKPGLDDKILVAWNGLMIKSLAEAGAALGNAGMLEQAIRAAEFINSTMLSDGRMYRAYREGRAHLAGYLEDHAAYAESLLALYEATFDRVWLDRAAAVTETMVRWFWDADAGFYDTAHDHESLITRPQDVTDGATPSGTSVAAAVLLRLSLLLDRPEWRIMAERVISRLSPIIQQHPRMLSYLASQAAFLLSEPYEIALVGSREGNDFRELVQVLSREYWPNHVVAYTHPDDPSLAERVPLLRDRPMVEGKATAYVCHHFVCRLPVTEPGSLREQLLP